MGGTPQIVVEIFSRHQDHSQIKSRGWFVLRDTEISWERKMLTQEGRSAEPSQTSGGRFALALPPGHYLLIYCSLRQFCC